MSISNRLLDTCVVVGLVLAAIVWALLSGKDVNFDQLHYHYYLGHSLFHDRLLQDFMPTNGQSYLNPVAYAPFYLMVAGNWHSLAIAALLAAIHSTNAVLAYLIMKRVLPDDVLRSRLIAALGALLAFVSPVYLNEIGTSFADVVTSALLLAGVFVALDSRQEKSWRDPTLVAGLCVGAACALKLSNLVFGPACLLLVQIIQPTLKTRVRGAVLFGIGCFVSFLALHGYWGFRLWRAIGNPVFPLFDNFFESGILPREGATLERFLPTSPLDSLLLPFRMIQARSWVYIESVSPDLRFAALVLVVVLGAVFVLARRKHELPAWPPPLGRRMVALSSFFLLSYALWQWTSGNGRYGLVVSILCGPMVALACFGFMRSTRASPLILSGLFVLQTFHLQNADLRWASAPWTATWYQPSIPRKLVGEPFLYISVGNNSNSFIFPYLHPHSAFTNPLGQTPLDVGGVGGRQLSDLLARHRGRVRFIAAAPAVKAPESLKRAWLETMDSQIARLGFAVDMTDCEYILASGPVESGQDFDATHDVRRTIGSCRLIERPFAYAAEREHLTKIAKEVVEWCPKLFKPAYTLLERSQDAWSAAYPATDSMLIIKDGTIYGVFTRASANILIGTVESWERGDKPKCESLPDKPRDVYNFE